MISKLLSFIRTSNGSLLFRSETIFNCAILIPLLLLGLVELFSSVFH